METEAREIDFKEIFDLLKKRWKLIFLVTFLSGIFSIFYSLSLTNIYTSSAVAVPSGDSDSGNMPGIFSNYSSLAGNFGIDLPNFSKGKNTYIIETRLKSKDFFFHLSKIENVLPKLMAGKAYNLNRNEIIYDKNLFNSKTGQWVNGPPSFMDSYRFFNSSFYINNDKIKGYLYLSFDHKSPQFAADFLNLIVKEYNELSRQNDVLESKKAMEYLTIKISSDRDKRLQETVAKLIEKQTEVQMLAEIRDAYILDFADEPFVPDIKSYPRRTLIVLSLTFLGFFFSVIYLLLRYYYFKNHELLN